MKYIIVILLTFKHSHMSYLNFGIFHQFLSCHCVLKTQLFCFKATKSWICIKVWNKLCNLTTVCVIRSLSNAAQNGSACCISLETSALLFCLSLCSALHGKSVENTQTRWRLCRPIPVCCLPRLPILPKTNFRLLGKKRRRDEEENFKKSLKLTWQQFVSSLSLLLKLLSWRKISRKRSDPPAPM